MGRSVGDQEEPRTVTPLPDAQEGVADTSARALPWGAVGLLLVLQYGLFHGYVNRVVTWCYPINHDQSAFLSGSYACYEAILRDGPARGLIYSLNRKVPTGLLFEAEAGVLYLILGPSRLSALALNFAHFALLQVAFAATLRWYARRWSSAFVGIGMLMATATPFYIYGGMADFRLDFAAFCLYGVFLCAVVRSGVFASWPWSVVAGATATLLILTRHFTAVYLAAVFASSLGVLIFALVRHHGPERRALARRIVGMLMASLTVLLSSGPVVLWKWSVIRAYYLGQFGNGESIIRGKQFGANDLFERIAFYIHSFTFDHAGILLLALAAFTSLAVLGIVWARSHLPRAAVESPGIKHPSHPGLVLGFASLCLIVPFTALAVFGSPSPVVANVMVAPFLMIAVFPFLHLSCGLVADRALAAVAAVAVVVGFGSEARQLTRPLFSHDARAMIEEVLRLYDRIGGLCSRHGWSNPRVAFMSIHDSLAPTAMTCVVYERKGVLLEPRSTIGPTIFAVSENDAMRGVRNSDFVVIPLSEKAEDIYPFVRCMREYRPQLLAVCRENFREIGRFRLPCGEVALFVRPIINVEGVEPDGWITEAGLTLSVDGPSLKSRPRIELRGAYRARLLDKLPSVRAELTVSECESVPLAVRTTFSDAGYRVVINVPPPAVPQTSEVQIHLDFDTRFIPAERPDLFGVNSDTRGLVLQKPETVVLFPAINNDEEAVSHVNKY
jgi:hypothetical protein